MTDMRHNRSRLDLTVRVRHGFGDPNSGAPYKTERTFLDFVVDGTSLYDAVGRSHDLASVLWISPASRGEQNRAVRRLLLAEAGDASEGRVSLFVCPECGDLGCGAITAHLERNGATIVWRDLGYENNYEAGVDFAPYERFGPYFFDADTYVVSLQRVLDTKGG